MTKLFSFLFSIIISVSYSQQTQAIDSAQYNVGYKIGENLPVAFLLIVAILFIIKSYRGRNTVKEKTDFMNDGTIEK